MPIAHTCSRSCFADKHANLKSIKNCCLCADELEVDDHDVDLAKVILSILICAVGLIGNFIAIFVIIMLKEYKKSVTHW